MIRSIAPAFEDRLRDRLVALDAVTPRPVEIAPAQRWRRRSLTVVAGVALVVGVGGVATSANLVLRHDRPTTVEAGGSLDVKGAGCVSGGRVVLLLDGVEAVSMSAAADGSFATRLPVSRDETTGTHQVSTRCSDSEGRTVDDTFAVDVVAPQPQQPAIGAPPGAEAGGPLAVKGGGFPAAAEVQIAWDGVGISTTRTDQDGAFFTEVRLPLDTRAGAHSRTARVGTVEASTRVVVGTP